MNAKVNEHREKVDALLTEGYRLWDESDLPSLPQTERYLAADAAAELYQGKYSAEFAVACQSFYLFRKLHGLAVQYPAWGTLLGDYFFSQFSKNLIPLDCVPLIDAFSRFLEADAQETLNQEDYLTFIGSLPVPREL